MRVPELAEPALGVLSALGSALAWTFLSLVARNLSPHFSAFSLNIIRSGVGSAFLVPLALATGDIGTLRGVSLAAWAYLMLSVVTAIGIGDTAFFESTKTLGLARAMTISTGYPLIASVLALWLFGERITPTIAAGSVVTLGGLVLIVSERAPTNPAAPGRGRSGLGLALVAALAWAVSATLMKVPLREVDPLTVQAVRLPVTALALWATPWARGTARTLWTLRRTVGTRVLVLGALTAVSAVTFLAGLKFAGIAMGTVLSSTSPLFALPIGLLAFGERVTWRAVAGAVLSIAGIAFLSL